MSLLPGVWGVHPHINAGSVLPPSVSACLLLQAPSEAAAAWMQAQEPGAKGNDPLSGVPVFLRLPALPVQVRDSL